MTIPFLTVKPKSIKLKVSPRFPALVIGRSGIDVAKQNGNYYLDIDFANYPTSTTLPSGTYTLIFNPVTGVYTLVPPTVFASTVNEAPTDGSIYGRTTISGAATWVNVLPLAGGTMTGLLILSGDPTTALGATTKQYVDTKIATYLTRNYLTGLGMSTPGASTTFTVAVGEAINSTNVDMIQLTSPISKTSGAWAAGTGNGAWDGTGTNPASSSIWQHVYLIKRTDTGIIDALISASATSPTVPSPYNEFRRIGAMKTTATGQWAGFIQVGDEFLWTSIAYDVNNVNPGISTTAYSLNVPTGITVSAHFRAAFTNTVAGHACYLSSPLSTGAQTLYSLANPVAAQTCAGEFNILTNTVGQINALCDVAAGNSLYLAVFGWTDRRGRDA